MPLVRNTETGNNFLEKINTGGDACSKTALRSYDKQVGSQGIEYPTDPVPPAGIPAAGETENYLFSLPFFYLPESHTLWVYVNGQKAEYVVAGGDTGVQRLEYQENSNSTVLFWYPLQNDDVIEFIVAGAYDGEVGDALIPDLSSYKTVDTTNVFTTIQPMNSLKFTGLGYGVDAGDSVRFDQLGTNFYNNVHFHTQLHDSSGNNPIIQTETGVANCNSTFQVVASIPLVNMIATGNDGQIRVSSNLMYMRYRVGTGAWQTVATFGMDSNKRTEFYGVVDMNSQQIKGLSPGTDGTDAVNLNQLNSAVPSTHYQSSTQSMVIAYVYTVRDGGTFNYQYGWSRDVSGLVTVWGSIKHPGYSGVLPQWAGATPAHMPATVLSIVAVPNMNGVNIGLGGSNNLGHASARRSGSQVQVMLFAGETFPIGCDTQIDYIMIGKD